MTDNASQSAGSGEHVEWAVMHPLFPDAPHRGPMTEQEARDWVAGVESVRAEGYYVGSRVVGPWLPASGRSTGGDGGDSP